MSVQVRLRWGTHGAKAGTVLEVSAEEADRLVAEGHAYRMEAAPEKLTTPAPRKVVAKPRKAAARKPAKG